MACLERFKVEIAAQWPEMALLAALRMNIWIIIDTTKRILRKKKNCFKDALD